MLLKWQQHVAEAAQPALAYCSRNNKIAIYVHRKMLVMKGTFSDGWVRVRIDDQMNITELEHRDVQ